MLRFRGAAIALASLAVAAPAFAHDAFGTMGPFWSGVLHLLVSPLSVGTIVALGAWLAPFPRGATAVEVIVSVAGAAIGAWLLADWSRWAAIAAVGVGLAAAFDVRLPRVARIGASAAAGLGIGSASAVDAPSLAAGAGVALVTFLALAATLAAFQELETRVPLARRVAGAWVAAIGLLIAALYLRG